MRLGTYIRPTEANKLTLRELIETYVTQVTPTHKGHKTEALRLMAASRHKFCETAIANLRPKVVAEWRDERLLNVQPATVVRELGMLQQVIDPLDA